MKVRYSLALIPFLVIIIIMLQTCSVKDEVTQPVQKKTAKKILKKNSSVKPTEIFSLSTKDTTIILPKSQRMIVVQKGMSKKHIEQLDNYLSKNHEISNPTAILPNALNCGVYIEFIWEFQSQYKSVSGKYLGIYNNYVSYKKLHNTYGFTMAYVSSPSQQDIVKNAGFKYDSIMVKLNNFNDAEDIINATNEYPKKAGYYEMDEPYERSTWNQYQILNIEYFLYTNYPDEKIMLTSYKWPVAPQYYTFLTTTYGDKYSAVLNSYGNEYIMCDQYHGNCLGSAVDYWSKFRDYYGSWNCTMNWLHVVVNNGSGGGHVACPYINEESSS